MDGEIGNGLDGTVSRSNQPARIYHEETNGSHQRTCAFSQRRRKDRRLWKCECRDEYRFDLREKKKDRKRDRRHCERCPDVLSGRTGGKPQRETL